MFAVRPTNKRSLANSVNFTEKDASERSPAVASWSSRRRCWASNTRANDRRDTYVPYTRAFCDVMSMLVNRRDSKTPCSKSRTFSKRSPLAPWPSPATRTASFNHLVTYCVVSWWRDCQAYSKLSKYLPCCDICCCMWRFARYSRSFSAELTGTMPVACGLPVRSSNSTLAKFGTHWKMCSKLQSLKNQCFWHLRRPLWRHSSSTCCRRFFK
mmetsp:Transcript_51940/g.149748  ORF Transcript_51940/g.149748 Transcript_51940/m.149748 type:complete len:212 (+) Transcript_51940:272-907(+)